MTQAGEAQPPGGNPKLVSSKVARLAETDLLSQARVLTKRKLEESPNSASLMSRLGDIERSLGDLASAQQWYARAERAEPGFGHCAAIAELLAGQPRAVAGLSEGVVEPFVFVPSPLPVSVLDALRSDRTGTDGWKTGRVGSRQTYTPSARRAMIRPIPEALQRQIDDHCAPFARKTADLLFAEPPDIVLGGHALIDYRIGDGYTAHRDTGRAGKRGGRRVLSIINYVWIDEERFSGGDLLIHDRTGNGLTRVRPQAGMALAFRSDALHEVTELVGSGPPDKVRRTALTLWYEYERTADD